MFSSYGIYSSQSKVNTTGNSLVVQWLGLWTFTATAWVQSLVRELRSHKLHGVAKKKRKKEKKRKKKSQHHRVGEITRISPALTVIQLLGFSVLPFPYLPPHQRHERDFQLSLVGGMYFSGQWAVVIITMLLLSAYRGDYNKRCTLRWEPL